MQYTFKNKANNNVNNLRRNKQLYIYFFFFYDFYCLFTADNICK